MKIYNANNCAPSNTMATSPSENIEPASYDVHITNLNRLISWMNGKGRKHLVMAGVQNIDTTLNSVKFAVVGLKKLKYVCAKLGQ